MAIKKSQLYSLLWASCDVLRGQYGCQPIQRLCARHSLYQVYLRQGERPIINDQSAGGLQFCRHGETEEQTRYKRC